MNNFDIIMHLIHTVQRRSLFQLRMVSFKKSLLLINKLLIIFDSFKYYQKHNKSDPNLLILSLSGINNRHAVHLNHPGSVWVLP